MDERYKHNERRNQRQTVARRAAELMYFDGIKEYLTAKRKAGRDLGVNVFPNNTEIRDEVDRLADVNEGDARTERLYLLRLAALYAMQVLDEFSPRLIGSVLSGKIKSTSDVDLHVFTDDYEEIGYVLDEHGMSYEFELVNTRKHNEFMSFPHFYVDIEGCCVELSTYPQDDLRKPQKSSITRRTMDRATYGRLRSMIKDMELPDPSPETDRLEDLLRI